MCLELAELKPGMSNVDVTVKVVSEPKVKHLKTGRGVEHTILEAKVEDASGSMILVLWDDKVEEIKVGDVINVKNGFVSSFRGEWRVNVGKYGEITKH